MATISSSNPPQGTSNKRTIKRKLDDSILKKARTALGLPLESKDDDKEEKQSDEPSLKWRKPRHNTTEGQIYVKNKEKRRLLELEEAADDHKNRLRAKSKKEDKKNNKKKRKNKKKKKADVDNTTGVESSKNPESEKRHAMEAVAYLQLWSTNRDHWKFEKRKQTWLLKNCLNADLIDEKRFEIFLEYVALVKGAARQATLKEMQSLVKNREMLEDGGDRLSSPNFDKNNAGQKELSSTVNDAMYDRARQIIQMLGEE